MVAPQLQALARLAVGAGVLDGAAIGRGRGSHPVCGDEVEVDVQVENARIVALRWRASGCPATLAVAAVAATDLVGAAPADSAALLRRGLAARGGLHAAELHAEVMFGRALRQALAAVGAGA